MHPGSTPCTGSTARASAGDSDGIAWWPVALSEELTPARALGVHLRDLPIVLWRDSAGTARALVDRCAHRRVPLSLGRVTADGLLQCGYHGWCYEGGSGRVRRIPNMLDKQRLPPIYRVSSYAVAESNGFIRVCLDKDPPDPVPGEQETLPLHGKVQIGLGFRHFVELLFDRPELLIYIPGVEFTEYLGSNLLCSGGSYSLDRYCVHRGHVWPNRLKSQFPFVFHVRAAIETGEARITLHDKAQREIFKMDLAPSPAARGTTAVRWRSTPRTGMLARFRPGQPPAIVREHRDAEQVAVTRPSISAQFARLIGEKQYGQ
jgi:nitrite reductase/ring-hydroxylating ferredoxin subunit